jgi:hypothetical protein
VASRLEDGPVYVLIKLTHCEALLKLLEIQLALMCICVVSKPVQEII